MPFVTHTYSTEFWGGWGKGGKWGGWEMRDIFESKNLNENLKDNREREREREREERGSG